MYKFLLLCDKLPHSSLKQCTFINSQSGTAQRGYQFRLLLPGWIRVLASLEVLKKPPPRPFRMLTGSCSLGLWDWVPQCSFGCQESFSASGDCLHSMTCVSLLLNRYSSHHFDLFFSHHYSQVTWFMWGLVSNYLGGGKKLFGILITSAKFFYSNS